MVAVREPLTELRMLARCTGRVVERKPGLPLACCSEAIPNDGGERQKNTCTSSSTLTSPCPLIALTLIQAGVPHEAPCGRWHKHNSARWLELQQLQLAHPRSDASALITGLGVVG